MQSLKINPRVDEVKHNLNESFKICDICDIYKQLLTFYSNFRYSQF